MPFWKTLSDEQLRDILAVPERGVGSLWDPRPLSVKLPDDLACPEDPSCTDLLVDPAGVLEDQDRWPDHLCYSFLTMSTRLWAITQIHPTTCPKWVDWQYTWPLPVGMEAVANELQVHPVLEMEILGQAPFKGLEEALWALRITSGGSAVDLFGLGIPSARSGSEQHDYKLGQLKYVLRGSGTKLVHVIERAQRWWDLLRGEITGGRPAGSSIWGSRIEFWIGLRMAVRALRANGHKLTQENIAERLGYSDRELRRWLNQYGIQWKDVPKIP